MPLSIYTNIAALRANRLLAQTTSTLDRTLERLSSGQRINSASDDAAGLAIADALRAESRVATVALRNANDGVSVISTADSALESINNVLHRMAELAEQSANGVFSNQQRSPLQAEFLALASEIERIAFSTKFNNIALLSGGQSIWLQIGRDGSALSRIQIEGIQGTLSSLALAISTSSQLAYQLEGNTVDEAQANSRTALAAVMAAISEVSSRRGSLGATESRLSHTINNLQTTRENLQAAESRIRDVDVAQEAASLVRLQILQHAGLAILAQANQQPAIALRLLGVNK